MGRRRKIELRVTTPNYIPGPFYICGNLKQIGEWSNHLKLTPYAEDEYHIEIHLTQDEIKNLEFKFTCGNFESVEVDNNFQNIPNRHLGQINSKQRTIKPDSEYQRLSTSTIKPLHQACQNLGDFYSENLAILEI